MAIDYSIISSEFVRKSLKYKNIEIVSVNSGDAFNVISGKAEIVLKTDDVIIVDKLASSLLIYFGESTSYKIEEI